MKRDRGKEGKRERSWVGREKIRIRRREEKRESVRKQGSNYGKKRV